MAEIFNREARKRFDDQHLQNRHKVGVACLLVPAQCRRRTSKALASMQVLVLLRLLPLSFVALSAVAIAF